MAEITKNVAPEVKAAPAADTKAAAAVAAKPKAPVAKAKKERIIFDVAYQPQVKTDRNTRNLMLDVIIALTPSVVVAAFQFGLYPLAVILVSMISAVVFEWGYRKFTKKHNTIGDLSAVVTGMLLALTLPATTPLWVPVIGTFFAIVVVKQLYGGIGKNFLNPALAGRAFLLASYATLLSGSAFTAPRTLSMVDGISKATPLSYLYAGKAMPFDFTIKGLLAGNVSGSMGELSTIAILMGLAYLLIMNVITWHIPVAYAGSVAVLTYAFGHAGYTNTEWMVYNLISGGMLFGAVFMATDYATSPVTGYGQVIYGIGCGVITVLIRYFGGYPEGATYAILLMNVCAWSIDKIHRRRQLGGKSRAELSDEKKAAKYAKLAEKYGEKVGAKK